MTELCDKFCVTQLCATPATQSAVGCLQVPRLPRKVPLDVSKCHACHAKCRGITARPIRSKRATRPSPVSPVPRLPRKWQADVAECHASHANGRRMWPSATPATQSAAASPRDQSGPSAPPMVCQRWCVTKFDKESVKMVCDKVALCVG